MHPQNLQYLSEPLAVCLGLAGRELVSLVGAGGKTSLMFQLAQELSLAGQRVITTTTTHIWQPDEEEVLIEAGPERLLQRLGSGLVPGERICLAADQKEEDGRLKLVGLSPEAVGRLWDEGAAEYILVEADGARGLPLKAPRDHEPVIPDQATVVVGLVGLSALGRPLDEEHVFAARRLAGLTGARPGQRVDPQVAAQLIGHPAGLFKGTPSQASRVLFLNQSDLPNAREEGLALIQILGRQAVGLRVVMASLMTGQREIFDLSG